MYSIKTLVFSLLLVSASSLISQVRGVVVKGEGDCSSNDHIVIETGGGYVFAEVYRGSFDEGDIVYGDLHSYGFENVKVGSGTGRIYIDDYLMDDSDIQEWCDDELKNRLTVRKTAGRYSQPMHHHRNDTNENFY